MFAPFKNQKGFTLIELVVIIILIGVLAAIAVPRYVDLRENAVMASAKATLDAGRAAVNLDFADQILNTGAYTDIFPNTAGSAQVTAATDRTNLENRLQTSPNYPPNGPYDSPSTEGFRWWQLEAASTTGSLSPPTLDAIIDVTCLAADSQSSTANDNCWASRL